jgi:K+-transporting ATPase ATPase C chain
VRRQLWSALRVTIALTVLLGIIYPLVVTGIAQVAFKRQANASLARDAKGNAVGSTLLGQNFLDKSGNPLQQYFQPRPSLAGAGYDATSSGASNLGPSNPTLIGFIPGFNTIGLAGAPSSTAASPTNPFATAADPFCVPTDAKSNAVTTPTAGQDLAKNKDGSYVCYSSTVPERAIAYRQVNGLAAGAKVPVDAVTASGSGLDADISVANALAQAPRVATSRHTTAEAVRALVHSHVQTRPWAILGEDTVNVLILNLALDRAYPST